MPTIGLKDPPATPNDAIALIGTWKTELFATPEQLKAIGREPLDVTLDQMRQLYVLLYPFMEKDFRHRDDLFDIVEDLKNSMESMINSFQAQLNTMTTTLNSNTTAVKSHFHPTATVPTAPSLQLTALPPLVAPQLAAGFAKVKIITSEISPNGIYKAGQDHIKPVVAGLGMAPYYVRDTRPNRAIGIVPNPISLMLDARARIYVPFDVGESDSALASNRTQTESRTRIDIL